MNGLWTLTPAWTMWTASASALPCGRGAGAAHSAHTGLDNAARRVTRQVEALLWAALPTAPTAPTTTTQGDQFYVSSGDQFLVSLDTPGPRAWVMGRRASRA